MEARQWTVGGMVAAGMLVGGAALVRGLIARVAPSPPEAVAALLTLALFAGAAAAMLTMGVRRLRTFWGALATGGGAVAVLLLSGLPAYLPLVGALWVRDDVSRPMVVIVALVVGWCFAMLFGRLIAVRVEAQAIRAVDRELPDKFEPEPRRQLEALITDSSVDAETFTARRIALLVDCCTAKSRMEPLLAEHAALDEAEVQAAYGPLRALVWALPALGFIGTAAAMSASIAGIGTVLRESAATTAQEHLLTRVVPQLADAFGITLVALGATVICFFALSLVFEREERELNRLDALMLRILTRVRDERPGTGADPSERLFAELWSVERELAKLNGALTTISDGRGFSGTLEQYLTALYTQVALVGAAIRGSPEADGGEGAGEGLASLLRDLRTELRRLNQAGAAAPAGSIRVPVTAVVDHRTGVMQPAVANGDLAPATPTDRRGEGE